MLNPKTVIFITGPTAVGKSKVAVEFARKIGGEIISCDSMQIYKGMDIITSKPEAVLRKKIRHHLIGAVSPLKEFNASKYRSEALKIIDGIISKGKVPIFAGGTGLYISTLIDGIFEEKNSDPSVRAKLYKQAQDHGNGYLYKKLKKADKEAAKKIHLNDTRRIVRALEVYEVTGKPISKLQKNRIGLEKDHKIIIFCLNMEREALYGRIDSRVEDMFKAGLLKEVKGLLKKKLSKTSRYAIGIGELRGYFKGAYDLEEAKRLMKRNSRHYAKAQLTWFRRDPRVKWINVKEKEAPLKIAGRLWKELY